ncbi:MAG: hypothetical protein IT347_02875 [Candidatus Eisenbacteria bacterium]|nr:hypothetical protein [Candidatus Eisenbacteria bacterium]
MASGPRISFSGVMLVVFGCLFLADQLGAIHFGAVFHTWWPAILVIAGLLGLIEKPASVFGPIIMLTVGLALLLKNLGYLKLESVWKLWPVILIALGLNSLFANRGGKG